MRLLVMGAFACSALFLACSGSTEGPTFTADDVRPSIEGTWKGSLVKGADSIPCTLTVSYLPQPSRVKAQCSNRTLSESGGELSPRCVDVSNLSLESKLVLQNSSTQLWGQLAVTGMTFGGQGSVSLYDEESSRIDAQLADGKLKGTASLKADRYEFTLTR